MYALILIFSRSMRVSFHETQDNHVCVLQQREVRRHIQNAGVGTKAQQGLKLQQEQLKTERRTVSREQREAEKERQFELKQQKKKKVGVVSMSVRSIQYDSENLDRIICYFMRTILHLQNTGVEDLPLENKLAEPFRSYTDTAMKLLVDGQPPEVAQLVLNAEYDAILSRGQVTVETAMGLHLIKELSLHIHYDRDYYAYLLSTENLWGNMALEYASFTFYPNLPEEIKDRYQISLSL